LRLLQLKPKRLPYVSTYVPLRSKALAPSRMKGCCNSRVAGEKVFQERRPESVSVLNKISSLPWSFLVRTKHDSRTFGYQKLSSSAGKMPSAANFIEYKQHGGVKNAVFLFAALNRPYQAQIQLKTGRIRMELSLIVSEYLLQSLKEG